MRTWERKRVHASEKKMDARREERERAAEAGVNPGLGPVRPALGARTKKIRRPRREAAAERMTPTRMYAKIRLPSSWNVLDGPDDV